VSAQRALAFAGRRATVAPQMNAPSPAAKPLLDPKELMPVAIGVAIGVAMLVGFYLLAVVLDLATFVESSNLPRQ
jgi:hypothetical protein